MADTLTELCGKSNIYQVFLIGEVLSNEPCRVNPPKYYSPVQVQNTIEPFVLIFRQHMFFRLLVAKRRNILHVQVAGFPSACIVP